MKETDFLSYRKLNDRLYLVQECFLNRGNIFNVYVAVGENRVGVFDTGLGVTAGLRAYIEENIVAGKSMSAYMSHVDLDHSGGAMLFDEAFLNERELPKLEWNLNVERRFSDLSVFCENNQEVLDFCKDRYLRNENIRFKNLDGGDRIDLGGIQFEVMCLPGHTPGSLIYYNRSENYVITGDAIQHHNTLQRCPDLRKILPYYDAFLEQMPEDIVIYSGHEDMPLSKEVAREVTEGIRDILAGNTKEDTPSGMPFPMIDPEELEYDVKQHLYKSVIILYNAKTLNQV